MEKLRNATGIKNKDANSNFEMPKKKKICHDKENPCDLDNIVINDSINNIEISDKLNLYKNKIIENDNIIKSLSQSKTELLQQNSKIVEQFNNEKLDNNSSNVIINEIQNGIYQIHEHQNLLVDRLNTLEEYRVALENSQQNVFAQLNKLKKNSDNIIAEKNAQYDTLLTIYNALEMKYNKKTFELEQLNVKCLSINEISYANQQLNDELLKLKDDKRMKETEYEQLEQNQKKLNENYIKSLNEIEIMKTTNMELLQIKNDLEESINQYKEKICQFDKQYKFDTNSLSTELEDKCTSLDTLKNKLEIIYKANMNLNECLNQSDNECELLRKQLQDLQSAREQAIDKTNNELENLRKHSNEETEKNIKLSNYCKSLHKQIESLESSNNTSHEIIEKLKAENQILIQDVKKKNCDIYSLTLEIEKNNNRKTENSESFKSISSRYIQNPSSISSIGSLRSNTIATDSMAQATDIQSTHRQQSNKPLNYKPAPPNYDSDSSFESRIKKANFIPQNVLQKKFFNANRNMQQNSQLSIIDRIRSSQKTSVAGKDTDKGDAKHNQMKG